VLLFQFGRSSALLKEYGEPAVETAMEKIGQLFAANIRSNDLAFRYDTTTIAILLGETGEKEGIMAVEKLRKIISDVRLPAKDGAPKGLPLQFCAGLAEALVQESYDPADIVTEVINRAEHALATAVVQGPGKLVALAAHLAEGAVA
jgi:GGDEF domain-containing protein